MHVWRDSDTSTFYDDLRRANSTETDLGGKWLMESHQPPFRLTFIHATGELVILREDEPDLYVEVIGWFPTQAAMEKAMAPALKRHGQPKGVYELRKRARAQGVEGSAVTEHHRQQAHAKYLGAHGAAEGQQGLF